MAAKPETKLRTKIVKAITDQYGSDARIFHPHGSQYGRNALDIVGCLCGYYFELEVKMPTNRTRSAAQVDVVDRVRVAGGVSGFVRSVQEALDILEGLVSGIEE